MESKFNQVVGVRMSCAQPRLVSQVYVFLTDRRLFVRVYHVPARGQYLVKVKLPKHTALALIWYRADWGFEGEWLTFHVNAGSDCFADRYSDAWSTATRVIAQTLTNISLT